MGLFNNAYFKLYDFYIKKELGERNADFVFLGHTHIHRENPFFKNVGSYKDREYFENQELVAISDVHLGLFSYTENELKKLREILEKNKFIVLLGDFFDLFYASKEVLLTDYGDIVELIKRRQKKQELVYIRGNHDWNIESILHIHAEIIYKKNNVLFLHGHTCDPWMRVFPFNLFYSLRIYLGYRLRFLRKLYLYFHV